MKGTIQKWKFMILLGALLFLSNMTFAEDKINHYTEGIPIDTTEVSISDKTNIPDRLYVDSLSLKRHFIHRIGIEARPGYIFPTSSFFRGEKSELETHREFPVASLEILIPISSEHLYRPYLQRSLSRYRCGLLQYV